MDWTSIGTQVILYVIGFVITGLGSVITYLINKYVKDEKLKNMLLSLDGVIYNNVMEIQQTYVDSLKNRNMFDKEAQQIALDKCLTKIKTEMTSDMLDWVKKTYDDPDSYLRGRIEAVIGSFKISK